MIVVAATILILYLLYRKFLYTPVNNLLQSRKSRVMSEINGAKALKEEASVIKADQEKILGQAKSDGQEIIENARISGEKIKENIIIEAKKEAKDIIIKSEKETERQKRTAMEEMKNQSVELAVMIAAKILDENISIDKHNKLINDFIDEAGNSQWQI